MSSAPGRQELRWFALCCACGALFNVTNMFVTLHVSDETIIFTSRLALFFGGIHACTWFKYYAAQAHRSLFPYERVIVGVGLVLSALSLVPNATLASTMYTRTINWLGVTYSDPPPTTFGLFAFAYHLAGLVLLFVRYIPRWRHGERELAAQCVAIGAVIFGVVHDSLASAGFIKSPYLLDLALLALVLSVGGSLARSFVANARALQISSHDLSLAHLELVKRERLAALGELAAVVAHEVRNPLAVVFNAIASLRKTVPGSKDHEALTAIIQEEAERLRDIVSDLLEFARPRPPVFAPAALEEVVRGAVETACGAAGTDGDSVIVEIATLAPVSCDERLVRQAVVNLVANALQAPQRKSPVRVSVRTDDDDDEVMIAVADDGAGIAADQRERIFTPFYSTRPSGTGLGLAVVRASVEAHHGNVILTDTSGGGATFTLRFPRINGRQLRAHG